MTPAKKSASPEKKNVTTIGGDVVDSVIVTGDNNQTIIQKFFNIFKSDSETLERRNRRILLGHVENAWIKGVLDASLHGAALLDLGIKQDLEAVTQYPWAIKRESTNETLPAGTSMLEIFDSIGMGRSLLILGAPGSGKTTMLLEFARQLIARAREDVTQPIPMVFNLASWTEKLSLADWLAQELNNLYSVPRKTAPDWVKGDKLLLLLDGLDEVRQESRAKCVEAINEFRKQNGLTSLAVCSRSQDYAEINAKLSFEGAIEVQPLTQEQIAEYFTRFGDEMAGIKQVFQKDSALREMAETPLFLSIMTMAYRDKQDVAILALGDEEAKRKHLFDTYIERMFERRKVSKPFMKQDVLRWLTWLAQKMIKHNQAPFFVGLMQDEWLDNEGQSFGYRTGSCFSIALFGTLIAFMINRIAGGWLECILPIGFFLGTMGWMVSDMNPDSYGMDFSGFIWNAAKTKQGIIAGLVGGLVFGWIGVSWSDWGGGLALGFAGGLFCALLFGLDIEKESVPNKTLSGSYKSFALSTIWGVSFFVLVLGLLAGLASLIGFLFTLKGGLIAGLIIGSFFGVSVGLLSGGGFAVRHYTLLFIMKSNNLLPWRLVPFLNHCVDLIFLRRVGGGYIFVHRLLMEHFAEMYVETPTSKGN